MSKDPMAEEEELLREVERWWLELGKGELVDGSWDQVLQGCETH